MKPIKVTDAMRTQLMKEFSAFLTTERMSNNKISFNKTIEDMYDKTLPKPIVRFTPEAYLKMWALVQNTDIEIGWHGLVDRQDNTFLIYDILLYPQKTTATTTSGDDENYTKWIMALEDEELDNLRFQGHSHVNMGTSPSGVDSHYYDSILQTLNEGDYYIFMIANKRNDIFINIYDFAKNIIFETTDCLIEVTTPGGSSIAAWVKTEKEKHIKAHTYTSGIITPGGGAANNVSSFDRTPRSTGDEYEDFYLHRAGIKSTTSITTDKKDEHISKKESKKNAKTCHWENMCMQGPCPGKEKCSAYSPKLNQR